MKVTALLLLIYISVLIFSCKGEQKKKIESDIKVTGEQQVRNEGVILEISLSSKNNSGVSGTVIFITEGEMVTMTANIQGLPEGVYAIHIHEKSDCSSFDGKSADGHWDPTLEPNGRKWGAKGDIGNFETGLDGEGAITFATNDWCIGCGDDRKDILGKAIVIVHKGKSDYTLQPSGAARSIVSCAAITQ